MRSVPAIPADGPLTVGGPGRLLTFPGPGTVVLHATAGQHLTVLAQRKSLTATDNTDLVIRRDDTLVAEGTLLTTWSDVSIDFTAPAAGTYAVEVRPRAKDRGTLLVSLAGASSGTFTVGAPPRKIAISTPGERAFLTFPATAGRKLTLVARRGTMSKDEYTHLEIRDPSGAVSTAGAVGYDADHRTLDFDVTTTGRHTLEINPDTSRTGTLTIQLVGAVITTLTAGRTARINLTHPGERAYVTFRAAECDQFRLTARRGTLTTTDETRLRLRTPAGLDVVDGTLSAEDPTATLGFSSSAGTYTLEIDPEGLDSGTLTLDLHKIT